MLSSGGGLDGPEQQVQHIQEAGLGLEFSRSGLKVEVDPVELGLYLAVAYQDFRGELEALGLAKVVQKQKFPRARKVTVATK